MFARCGKFKCIVATLDCEEKSGDRQSTKAAIGVDGRLPWGTGVHLRSDMRHFAATTTGNGANAVIMGRRTWESLPSRPLRNRINVVLSRNAETRSAILSTAGTSTTSTSAAVLACASLAEALQVLSTREDAVEDVFVIGGASVYESAFAHPACCEVLMTRVRVQTPASLFDTFLPSLSSTTWKEEEEEEEETKEGEEKCTQQRQQQVKNGLLSSMNTQTHDETGAPMVLKTSFVRYVRQKVQQSKKKKKKVDDDALVASSIPPPPNPEKEHQHEEYQYLRLVRHVLEHGKVREDRTGTGTRSVFGDRNAHLEFSLRGNMMPVLTTKRVFWRGVVEELLWFLRGETNAKSLSARGVRIWDSNGSRAFLDSCGFKERPEGDLGPVYGFQWRHFGTKYRGCDLDYSGEGVDQLARCIDLILHEPESRRIVLCAWNPAALDEMVLPPCHMLCQFYVCTQTNELSCMLTQRSGDIGLGVPFNIASYALLTHILAYVCGRKPGKFVHVIGDAHVYTNHIGALAEQLRRTPTAFPKLAITKQKVPPRSGTDTRTRAWRVQDALQTIESMTYFDMKLLDYLPAAAIPMVMAV